MVDNPVSKLISMAKQYMSEEDYIAWLSEIENMGENEETQHQHPRRDR